MPKGTPQPSNVPKTREIPYLAIVKQFDDYVDLDTACPRCLAPMLETPSGFICQNCPSGLFRKVRVTAKVREAMSGGGPSLIHQTTYALRGQSSLPGIESPSS
jgi:hypothetical protein